MKATAGLLKSKRSILLGALTILMVGILSPLFVVDTVTAAAPDSLTVNGTDCRLVMSTVSTKNITRGAISTYNITSLPGSVMDGIDANPEIKADYDYYANANALTIPAILYDAVVAGNGDPQTNCREAPSVMYMSPSNPTKFFGTQIGNEILLTGTLDVAARTFTFDATTDGTYTIGGDLTNPIFQQATTSVGFCAIEAQVGPSVYSSCMRPAVVDFNTISWRGERYTLQAWRGNQSTRMEYVLDRTTSPYAARKNSTCTSNSMFRIDGDDADDIGELTADGDNGISGFFGQLDSLTGNTNSQTIQYRDYDALCSPIHEGDDDDIELYDAANFLRVAQYFAKDNAVVIIPRNPGDGEKSMSQTYTKSATDPTLFVAPEGAESGDCPLTAEASSIKFSADPSAAGAGTYLDAIWTFPDKDNSCSALGANIKVKFTPADSAETLADAVNDGAGAGAEEVAVPEKTCSSEGGGLGWIVCPVLTVLDEATQWLENQIRGFLFVEPEQFDKDAGGAGLYRSWSTFRGLATIVIVIIALLMIFSQAMGEGVFNNYSVKKLLPRLIIAGIGIQLSWFLITELINVFNIIGNGISGLIMSPFTYVNDSGATTSLTVDTNLRDILPTSTAGGQGVMAGIVIAGGIALVGAAGALAIGATAAVFVGFITLIVRNIIIFLGVIFAPVAIAMSVLPGTQKTAKWWWESLSKALMMYPLVMVLFAGGKIVSNILMTSGPPEAGLDTVTTIAAIAAWYAPYFFLPKALQAGGSALGKVTGLAGDKSKGMFDKARQANDSRKKFRQGLKQEARVKSANGQGYWQGKGGRFGSGINTLMQGQSKARIRTQSGLPIIPIKQRVRDRVGASESAAAAKVEKVAMDEFQTRWSREVKDGRVVGGNDEQLIKIALTTSNATERQAALDQLGKLSSKQLLHVENALNGADPATRARGLNELASVAGITAQQASSGLSNIGQDGFARTKQDNYGNIKDKLPVLAGKDYHKLGSGALAEISSDSITDMGQKFTTYDATQQQTLKSNITEYLNNTNLHGKIDAAGMAELESIKNRIP